MDAARRTAVVTGGAPGLGRATETIRLDGAIRMPPR
jgi:NAD(P)-dependent dehydrogenase (short-subunit alcohol dehydrogenase family)